MLVAEELGVTVTHVPYRGAGPALNDLLAGMVDVSSQSTVVAGPLVKAGKLKAYAIIGRNRFAGPARSADHGRAWLPEARPRLLAHAARASRHAAADRRPAQRRAAHRARGRQGAARSFDEGGMDLFRRTSRRLRAAAALLKSEIKLWGDVIRANNIVTQ